MIKMKEAGSTALKFGAGAAGLTVGAIGLKQLNKIIPDSFPEIAKKVSPGILGMLVAYLLNEKVSDSNLKALAFGLGLAGFADLAKKLLGDKIPLIGDNVPSLSGFNGSAAVNVGDFPPSYYEKNSFQGVQMNGDSYSLMGAQMQGFGETAYALSGGAFALN